MGKSFKTIGVKIYSFGLGGRFLFASVMADKVSVASFGGSEISGNMSRMAPFTASTGRVASLFAAFSVTNIWR